MRTLIAALIYTTCVSAHPALELPLPATPGRHNGAVTQENLQETICVPGFTKTIRPPASYTNRLKQRQLLGPYRGQGTSEEVEEDHLIPLTVGGHPTDERNLWPQPRAGEYSAVMKDRCEVRTNRLVCDGEVPLREAQQGIARNWIQWCRGIGAIQ